jgi:hypothetical protein
VAWSRFVPFVRFVGGGEGRWEGFEEGPPREKERDVIVLRDVCCARGRCMDGRDLGSFVNREVDVSVDLVLAFGGTLLVFYTTDFCIHLSLQDSLSECKEDQSLSNTDIR